jgi:2-polyprenyl-3-methyl-5-hydroxy-6-metoxy-1,4-benzoquinol methylase
MNLPHFFDNKERKIDNYLTSLRKKWHEVPAGNARISTRDLINLSDNELRETWLAIRQSAITESGFSERGWYHELYRDIFRTKKIMDVGSGLGIDGITFAEAGAHVTFVDIVQSNLEVIKRLCGIFQIKNVDFCYLQNLESLRDLPRDYDVIWCQGSLINAPFENIREEAREILNHLPVGGRWIELAYPKNRWVREGQLPFTVWGNLTDGEGTPWMEWYDLEKIKRRFDPTQFDVILSFEFHNGDFIWFDLVRVNKTSANSDEILKGSYSMDIRYNEKYYNQKSTRPILLFSYTADNIIWSLEFASKTELKIESILKIGPSGIEFNPADRTNHLSTPFLSTKSEIIDGKKCIRIMAQYKKEFAPDKDCRIYLQNEQYKHLTPPVNFDQAYALNLSDMEVVMVAGIDKDESGIRVVISTIEGKTTFIPHTLKIEQLQTIIR